MSQIPPNALTAYAARLGGSVASAAIHKSRRSRLSGRSPEATSHPACQSAPARHAQCVASLGDPSLDPARVSVSSGCVCRYRSNWLNAALLRRSRSLGEGIDCASSTGSIGDMPSVNSPVAASYPNSSGASRYSGRGSPRIVFSLLIFPPFAPPAGAFLCLKIGASGTPLKHILVGCLMRTSCRRCRKTVSPAHRLSP